MGARPEVVAIVNSRYVASFLEGKLREAGYEPIMGRTGRDGLGLVMHRAPAAVVLDDFLPDQLPLLIVRAMRRTKQGAEIPIVLLTHKGKREEVIRAARAGVTTIVLKAFAPRTLLRKLDAIFAERGLPMAGGEDELPAADVSVAAKVQQILPRLSELMAVPFVVERVLTITGDSDTGASDLEKVVRSDPSIAACVLRRANSSLYGAVRKIGTLMDAITRIGFREVRSLVLGLSVIDMFPREPKSLGFDRIEFWKQSICCGILARLLARNARWRHAEDAFTIGLLHDIGKMVLDERFSDDYERAIDMSVQMEVSIVRAERAVFEIDNETVGKTLLERWRFPSQFTQVVGRHSELARIREELKGDELQLAEVTWMAKNLVKAFQVGFSGDRLVEDIPADLLARHHLDHGFTAELETQMFEEYEEMVSFLGIGAQKVARVDRQAGEIPDHKVVLFENPSRAVSMAELTLRRAGYDVQRVEDVDRTGACDILVIEVDTLDAAREYFASAPESDAPRLVLMPRDHFPKSDQLKERVGLPVKNVTYIGRPFHAGSLLEAISELAMKGERPHVGPPPAESE